MEEALKAFALAMENGDGKETTEELECKRKKFQNALADYIEEAEKQYFVWGYMVGKADGEKK